MKLKTNCSFIYLYQHTLHEETMRVMTEDMPSEISYVPSAYMTEITHVSQALSEVEQILNAPELCAKDFEDLFKQEESLKVKAKHFHLDFTR